jgi:hypothetical protein
VITDIGDTFETSLHDLGMDDYREPLQGNNQTFYYDYSLNIDDVYSGYVQYFP